MSDLGGVRLPGLESITVLTNAASYQEIQGNNPDGTRHAQLPVYFDKLDYIEYVILNYWGGNWDWSQKNFWLTQTDERQHRL